MTVDYELSNEWSIGVHLVGGPEPSREDSTHFQTYVFCPLELSICMTSDSKPCRTPFCSHKVKPSGQIKLIF
jgi:hypothetical protein